MAIEKSFNYFGTMMQLLHDYAATRLKEIREEAKILEAFLSPSGDRDHRLRARVAAPLPPLEQVAVKNGSLQDLVLREVLSTPKELRPNDVRLKVTASGWRFRDRRSGLRAVANALTRLVEMGELKVRKDGETRRSPVFYSAVERQSEPEGM